MAGIIERECRGIKLKFSVESSFVVHDASMGQEQEILDLIDELDPETDVFIDIGAAMARFAMYAAAKGIPSVAIEPEYRSYDLIETHKKLNDLSCLQPLRAAIGDVTGPGELLVGQPCANGRHRMLATAGGRCDLYFPIVERQDIEVFSLDDIQAKYAGTAIKVDIDGAETEFLRGGLRSLKGSQIKNLIIELQERDNKFAQQEQTILDCGFELRSKHHVTGKGLYNYWYIK